MLLEFVLTLLEAKKQTQFKLALISNKTKQKTNPSKLDSKLEAVKKLLSVCNLLCKRKTHSHFKFLKHAKNSHLPQT